MPTVRVPTELLAALLPALALRGLRATVSGAAALVVGPWRGESGRWLALVADEPAAIAALDDGANDVVIEGTAPALIAARADRLLRPSAMRVGGLTLDPVARTVRVGARRLVLYPREFALLLHLAQHAGSLVTRAELNAAIWGRGFDPGTNVIEVHMSRLRRALGDACGVIVLTERGRGYRLAVDPPIAAARLAS